MANGLPHICLICSRLDLPGGIERAIVNMANLFQAKGHKVSIIITDNTVQCFYTLHPEISITNLVIDFGIKKTGNMLSKKMDFVRHVLHLKKQIRCFNADVVIGTEYAISIGAYLACRGHNVPVFAWEHHHFSWLQKSRFWSYLFRIVYPRLSKVICLNPAEEILFKKMGCRTAVIPNFVSRQAQASLEAKIILSVGWLINRKGFDLIPAIAEHLFAQYPGWQWIILGSGVEAAAITKNIRDRNLSQQVIIVPPVSPDIDAVYAGASIYVMTSRFECFPMVLLEAASHGVPCVSFDCPTGPAFIISDGEDGLVIPQGNVAAMTDGISGLMANAEKRKLMGEAAYRNIRRFAPEEVYKKWTKAWASL